MRRKRYVMILCHAKHRIIVLLTWSIITENATHDRANDMHSIANKNNRATYQARDAVEAYLGNRPQSFFSSANRSVLGA